MIRTVWLLGLWACQYASTRDDAAALIAIWEAEYKVATSNRTQSQ